MSANVPLLHGFAGNGAICAWRRGRGITVGQFAADVVALASTLPARDHVLNVARDRYRFAVGLAAALVRGQVSLLPPSVHAATIAQLVARHPDLYALVETPQGDIDLPQTFVEADGRAGDADVPSIPVDRTVALVFTSGSTGAPVAHRKRWGSLVRNVRAEGLRLGCTASDASPPHAIVATVPPQHMYGFESSLVMAWQGGVAFVAERPFYPADVAAALAGVPARATLVTTPFHLRALVADDTTLPALARIVCATAPLSAALAQAAETRFGAPVLEIYGCTETGQLASRRPVEDPRWQLFPDIDIRLDDGRAIASGGHVEQPTPLADVLELAADFAQSRRFDLAGRAADLVNIAGKRTSLGHLNLQLQAIDGVLDGVFMIPDDEASDGSVTRLAAIVVAPTLDAKRLLDALRARLDPVFLPRPIHFVDAIPRNETGKLTQAVLRGLLAATASARAAGQHPSPGPA